MACLTAMLLIDVPAGALNNSGEAIPNARTQNTSSVKTIRKRGVGEYPYFTAQAYRRWLRQPIASKLSFHPPMFQRRHLQRKPTASVGV